jgi:hypothetical protein
MPDSCAACDVGLNEEIERTTRRLLASLDDERRGKLAETYQGTPPDVLCAGCMNVTVAVLNGA